VYLSHGGGPCFFMDWDPPGTWDGMQRFLEGVPGLLAERPRAIVVISAHAEASPITITAAAAPELLYDYSGFPPHTMSLTYPALGDPALAEQIHARLGRAGIASVLDESAPFDHGVFIPLKVSWPDASIPVVAVSLDPALDPSFHLALGAALEPLRDQGVLIIGSGASYHGRGPDAIAVSEIFDAWLTEAMDAESAERADHLRQWADAPGARSAHPREEHLIPLMVVVGAAGADPSTRVYSEHTMGRRYSAWAVGDVVAQG
jgi:aromatic ring-opening dioxygenase catalytic subunit (LigB family)